jgi:hypothetical protein
MWAEIQIENPIWYFDSTGGINLPVKNQKAPFFYSIIMHDVKNKTLIPLGEWVSTAATSINTSSMLFKIKQYIQLNLDDNKLIVASIIVVDFNWASINSIMYVCNDMPLIVYLIKSFAHLQKKAINSNEKFQINTRLYLCSFHFLKNMLKNAKKKCKDKYILKSFAFTVTLLQNSTDLEQFVESLRCIFFFFNSQYHSRSYLKSLCQIRLDLLNRAVNAKKIELSDPILDQEDENYNYFCDQAKCKNEAKSIYEMSPYQQFFKAELHKLKHIIKTEEYDTSYENKFYSPELFNLIVDELYLMPLWTGVLISEVEQNDLYGVLKEIIRLTNNPVECYFKIIKVHYLLKNGAVMPSELISKLYSRLKSKFYSFYCRKRKEPIFVSGLNKANDLSYKCETWKKGPSKTKRKKGYYMDNCSNFAQLDDTNFENFENNIETFDFISELDGVFIGILNEQYQSDDSPIDNDDDFKENSITESSIIFEQNIVYR